MNLHVYQAKELLKKFDLPVPKGIVFIENLSQIEENLETLKASFDSIIVSGEIKDRQT